MYCENCGERLPHDAKFCPNCGHNVAHSGLSNFSPGRWSQWSGERKSFSIMVVCIIALVVVSGLTFNMHSDVQDQPADNSYDGYSDVSNDDLNEETYTTVVDESPAQTESSTESSASHTQSQDTSSNYDNSGAGGSYLASSKSNKFHRPSCGYVDNIKSGNLISFSSRDEAISSGYSPCKACSP